MATTCGSGAFNFWMARVPSSSSPRTRVHLVPVVLNRRPWTNPCGRRERHGYGPHPHEYYYSRLRAAAAEILSEKVEKSVAEAKEVCWDDPESGECVAAWDVVEELSAAASHARDREKETSDPLDKYCKEHPETDECRVYDN